jgi:hypothetical protein
MMRIAAMRIPDPFTPSSRQSRHIEGPGRVPRYGPAALLGMKRELVGEAEASR